MQTAQPQLDNPAEQQRRRRPDAAFVICVEPGALEYKALCLVLTLRKNAGAWKDLPLYAYSPRPGRQVAPWLKTIFARHHVTLVEEPVNQRYQDYPLANKPLCMAHAEAKLAHEYIVFLDSDILVWKEPAAFELPAGRDVGAVVDADKSMASSGDGDHNEVMWQRLYALLGGCADHFVTTTLSRERVRGWWCSGVIAVRRERGLMAQWLALFERALESDLFLPRATYLREQMTFSATLAKHAEIVENLAPIYNFHVQSEPKYVRECGLRASDAVLWHYQCFLDKAFARFRRRLDDVEDSFAKEAHAWGFIQKLRVHHARMLGMDEPFLKAVRRKLRIGIRLRAWLGRPSPTDSHA